MQSRGRSFGTKLIRPGSATILYRPDQSYEDVKKLAKRISHRAISLEGTSSGEHGVVRAVGTFSAHK